ncbi:putative hemin ABC transport system protein [uncultured Alphaproteobacteria bacterium]|uniref:Putative hemin ABC transport system protein n=1 Tax=uncultured Alphaproteobacteria bacterium TaxID=91750 RepID=A0A212IUU3_9PROT|nr:putative hemin ABC transport system protein [uncultured Alphaproteobacteria bacterium]
MTYVAPSNPEGSFVAADWASLFARLEAVGEVEAVTRNPVFAHRKTGRFGNVRVMRDTALVLNREIDLRIFLSHWVRTVAVADGLDVFDADGTEVFSLRRTEATDAAAWAAVIGELAAAGEENATLPSRSEAAACADAEVDVAGLREAWSGLTDVHQFAPMLRRFGVSRMQALRLAGSPWARDAGAGALVCVLEAARAAELPIMIFVDSPGCTQIHTGPVDEVRVRGDRLDVRGPAFALAGDLGRIGSCWAVRKPTEYGGITTLEVFDRGGVCRAIVCGQRDPGATERPEWTDLVLSLSDAP